MRLPYENGTVRVSSPYGNRTLDGANQFHHGIDLVGSNKNVVSVCDGFVRSSAIYTRETCRDDTWQWGNYVRVDGFDGNRYFYCHLASRAVPAGQEIHAGDLIGVEGNTGYSFGNHLHFEVRNSRNESIDPTPFIGIRNNAGAIATAGQPDYADLVCKKCGLEPHTRAYLDGWKWSEDLWRKLWEAMR